MARNGKPTDQAGSDGEAPSCRPQPAGPDLAEVREQMLASDEAFRAAWQAQELRRQIVTVLLSLRREAGLTQRELARRAGWSPAFVSRLESIPARSDRASIPSVQTLLTYAAACNRELGLVFGHQTSAHGVRVDEAVSLGRTRAFGDVVGALDDKTITLERNRVRVAG